MADVVSSSKVLAPGAVGDGGGGSGISGSAAARSAAAGRAAASPKLESSANNRKCMPTGKVYVRPSRCRCRTCPECGPRYGRGVRWQMMQKAPLFICPALLTLTVDRSHFGSPLDAFLVITTDGYVRRLMRLLGVKRWAWVLEFQMKTGEGWPHWHLLINLPPGGIDLRRAWRLWRDKWGLGGLMLSVPKAASNPIHGVRYITKYLIKQPDEGFPAWVLQLDRRIRWVGTSRTVGRVVADRESTAKDAPGEDVAESLPREHRPLAIRQLECGKQVDLFRELQDDAGERVEFFGRLPLDLFEAGQRGRRGVSVHNAPDGRVFVVGTWATFREFANQLLEAARGPGGRELAWSDRERTRSIREAMEGAS